MAEAGQGNGSHDGSINEQPYWKNQQEIAELETLVQVIRRALRLAQELGEAGISVYPAPKKLSKALRIVALKQWDREHRFLVMREPAPVNVSSESERERERLRLKALEKRGIKS